MKVIEDENLSYAWARAVHTALDRGGEISPLVVSVVGSFADGMPPTDSELEKKLDVLLGEKKANLSIGTVASSLFPLSLWNPDRPRNALFERFMRLWPKIKKSNPHGHYFHRLITLGGPATCGGNQLDFIIGTYSERRGVRRSMLQAATFDASADHSKAAQRGFPCLQQVAFAVQKDKTIAVSGFYAFQYLGQRAYGNYVGLCRLGHFVAHELGTTLSRMTCYAGIAQTEIGNAKLRGVIGHLDQAVFKED